MIAEVSQVSREIKVLCADDNASVLDAVRLSLDAVPGIKVCGCLTNAAELVERSIELCPDVVLLDIDMPGSNPFQALARLAQECPKVRVIMFSAYYDEDLIDDAFAAGAWGYVFKNDAFSTLVKSIRDVTENRIALSPSVDQYYART